MSGLTSSGLRYLSNINESVPHPHETAKQTT
jgi:hypothetical protein